MKTIVRTLLMFVVLFSNINAQDIEINGYSRSYMGVLTNEKSDYAIIQNTLNLNLVKNGRKTAFNVNPYIYQYPNQELVFGFREGFMDIYFDNMDLRIGKQQIIWGKADGVFITDIVSPKDLSEFLLPDFDEIRTGVTSLKANYYFGDKTLEFVWIPIFTPTRMPDNSSIWFRQPSFDLPITVDNSFKVVPERLDNSELFLKYSGMSSMLDFEIIFGSMWDDDPTTHVTYVSEPGNIQPTGLILFPQYHRLAVYGSSFSTTLGGIVVRGEGAYYTGKHFSTEDPTAFEGVIKKDYLHYLLGIDGSVKGAKLSVQLIRQAILNYESGIVNNKTENTATFLLSKDFLRETLRMELFSYIGLNNNDALIRPKIIYDFADEMEILAGANIFIGKEGYFGNYSDNDMVYIKLRYNF